MFLKHQNCEMILQTSNNQLMFIFAMCSSLLWPAYLLPHYDLHVTNVRDVISWYIFISWIWGPIICDMKVFVIHITRLCVSPPPRALIISGVIWCNIDHVWLVKQVLWLFPFLNCLIWHLPSIKWMGMALLIQESLPKKTKFARY